MDSFAAAIPSSDISTSEVSFVASYLCDLYCLRIADNNKPFNFDLLDAIPQACFRLVLNRLVDAECSRPCAAFHVRYWCRSGECTNRSGTSGFSRCSGIGG